MGRIQSRNEILRLRPFGIEEISYQHPSGKLIERALVTHPGAVVIVPVTPEGRFLLVRQYRWAVEETLLEFPAGTREPDEEALITAQRELAEEVGMQAAEWVFLGQLCPAPGFCNERQWCYLARGLTPRGAVGDEDEEIEVVSLSLSEVEEAIRSNVLIDGKSIAVLGLCKAKDLIK